MNLKEFEKLWKANANDPVKVIELFMSAMLVYEKNQRNGAYMISYLLPKDDCIKDRRSPTGLVPNPRGVGYMLNQMLKNPNIVRSYIGGTPENGYRVDPKSVKLNVVLKEISSNRAKVVIQSAGKDNPTPISLKIEDGCWKISSGISSIATGVKPPA